MSDQFSHTQRFAIWSYYGQRCYYCDELIHFRELAVDHVLPERLLGAPEEFAQAIARFGLPTDFRIDDYCNWLPCHSACNLKKGGKVIVVTPKTTQILHDCIKNAEAVRNRVIQLEKEPKKEKLIIQIQNGVTSGTITKQELLALVDEIDDPLDRDYKALVAEIYYHINTERWKEVGIQGDIATVTDGPLAGITPVNLRPLHTWQCPFCFSYGPWSGARCLNCGYLSDPAD